MNRKSIYAIVALFTISTLFYPQTTDLFYKRLSDAAKAIIDPSIIYDPTYRKISYPLGDVDKNKGVCTDVVIRAYRILEIDLQKEVHEDMKINFSKYPSKKHGVLRQQIEILIIDEYLICKLSFPGKERF